MAVLRRDSSVAEPAVVELSAAGEPRGEVAVRRVAPRDLGQLNVFEDSGMAVEVGVGSQSNARAVTETPQHSGDVLVDVTVPVVARVRNADGRSACSGGRDEPLGLRKIRRRPPSGGTRVARVRAVALVTR